jgi:hypothetical protein
MTHANRDALPTPNMSDATAAALLSVLEPGEGVEQIVLAVGCCLVLTERRCCWSAKVPTIGPKTGVGSWPTDGRLRLHLEAGPNDSARLSITREGRSASVFLRTTRSEQARSLVATVRQRAQAA